MCAAVHRPGLGPALHAAHHVRRERVRVLGTDRDLGSGLQGLPELQEQFAEHEVDGQALCMLRRMVISDPFRFEKFLKDRLEVDQAGRALKLGWALHWDRSFDRQTKPFSKYGE